MNYGPILKKYRVLSGYSQEEMAYYLGVYQTMVSKIENGHRGIDLPIFIEWANLVVHKEEFLQEVGLLKESKNSNSSHKNVLFEIIKKEMLQQQHH